MVGLNVEARLAPALEVCTSNSLHGSGLGGGEAGVKALHVFGQTAGPVGRVVAELADVAVLAAGELGGGAGEGGVLAVHVAVQTPGPVGLVVAVLADVAQAGLALGLGDVGLGLGLGDVGLGLGLVGGAVKVAVHVHRDDVDLRWMDLETIFYYRCLQMSYLVVAVVHWLM